MAIHLYQKHYSKCSTYNFSLQYPYTIQQTGNEIAQTYQLEVVIMIFLSLNYKEMCNS